MASEVKRALGKLKVKKGVEALHNPCTHAICIRNAEEKVRLEVELNKAMDELGELKEESEKNSLKYSSSIRMRDEATAELAKIQAEFVQLKDTILEKEKELIAVKEKAATTQKALEAKVEQLQYSCAFVEEKFVTLQKQYNVLVAEDQEKGERIKALEGNVALTRTDYECLVGKYGELFKQLTVLKDAINAHNSANPACPVALPETAGAPESDSGEPPATVTKIIYATNPCRKWVQNIKEILQCPITGNEMKEPTICSDGQTYEREAIQAWYKSKHISPITREVLDHTMYKNYAVKKVLDLIQAVEDEWSKSQ